MSDKQHQEIDPAGQEVVLEYVGPGHLGDVPARDLDGGDIARIAWVRAHRVVEWEREGAADPPQPTPKQVAKLAAELVETGVYNLVGAAKPKAAAKPKPEAELPIAGTAAPGAAANEGTADPDASEPATPAETPEA